jgi:Peptidase family M1 domain
VVTPACATRAEPDPNRPRVQLRFTFSADLTHVHGTEHIVFTPDRPISELVFRLTANSPATVQEGNRIVVDRATADHGARPFTTTPAGAPATTQGGLLRIPFVHALPAGTTVTADLTFDVTLGTEAFDRFAYADAQAGRFAWFGSAQPLLAWERGYGWHTEDLIQFTAESATSEAMDTDLTVVAPGKDTVIMSGDPADPPASTTPRMWHSTITAARDVAVAVGPFAVTDTVVGGVRLRLGSYDAAVGNALVPEFQRAITELQKRFGPFPFPSLSVARVPSQGGGIEYPSAILMLAGSREVAVHETAHQWFYAMLGDSQSLHPWLDEAFASYAEQLVDSDAYPDATRLKDGTVDRSVESYGNDSPDYYFVTYAKGSTALQAARNAAGAAAWDAAIRCYLNENAWRIVNPPVFAAAIAKFPAAVAILRKAGALR